MIFISEDIIAEKWCLGTARPHHQYKGNYGYGPYFLPHGFRKSGWLQYHRFITSMVISVSNFILRIISAAFLASLWHWWHKPLSELLHKRSSGACRLS